MSRSRALYHMVRADFLERVRRYSFLLTLAFSVYLGYAVNSGQVTLRLGAYRGVDNSAWLGSVIGLVATVWLTLVGFYVVKNSIQRDRQTRVGQVLAATPMSKSFYALGKALSNFAVLAAMVLVLALAALVIQLSHGADSHIDLFALLAPALILGLSAVAVTAALAVLFESLPALRGGVGNIFYFFLWTFLLTESVGGVIGSGAASSLQTFKDYSGITSVMGQMRAQLQQFDPQYGDGASFGFGNASTSTKTFLWTGVKWSSTLVFSRGLWLGIAVGVALLAALFFDRFDPARDGLGIRRKQRPVASSKSLGGSPGLPSFDAQPAQRSVAHLVPVSHTGSRTRFFALVLAELRLMLRSHAWWWYVVAAGLIIACLASPLDVARSGILVAAWLWPALIWSQMGTREAQFSTGPLIFSAPHAVRRQLLACYSAGVLVAALTGGGVALHLLFARDIAGLGAWATGALFIPALALALGVTTGSRKFFEALYTAWWYVGPLHHIPRADFMGTTAASSTPVGYLAAALLLVLLAYAWRTVRLANA